ncbi:hypothetical protein GGR54DRAFT_630502 [Hypoxylon sp. NC1633]|nr:hypothetical protein GGR54DRAFT_630502 [Hypoxylon sp. NC1633]
MAREADLLSREPRPPSDTGRFACLLKRIFGRNRMFTSSTTSPQERRSSLDSLPGSNLIRRVSRKVVPGLPRAKTFKRQQSEVREKLEAIEPTPAERRAVSVDRRLRSQRSVSHVESPLPRASAPDFLGDNRSTLTPPAVVPQQVTSAPQTPFDEKQLLSLQDVDSNSIDREQHASQDPAPSYTEALPPIDHIDAQSTTTSQYEAQINDDLERKWILNLSMHFRDQSRREKFFVTYREEEFLWRRVTISLDYRSAPDDSLEKDLLNIKFQREKSAKIYEAIRDSLQDIQFYPTVTNLKLQTTDGRLHVHVVEDVNEIISYPTVRMIQHLNCQRIRERDLVFDSHMSGFVYKVRVAGRTLIKKEIPGPDTVDEFLYEVNALNSLRSSQNVIKFYGVVVDDDDENVKGLLIDYAEKGALIDVIYDSQEEGGFLPWSLRERWARQIVQGVSDVHEAGFVQGDLTLSNIVIDSESNAKIIDINRRGCPVGWEPPEATPLIDSNQRISMYIGVKSDLYQLGMVLWALATLEDEPEAHRRPLHLDPEIEVPEWYRTMVEYCLHEDPRVRLQATTLLTLFPQPTYEDEFDGQDLPSISVDDGFSLREYMVDEYQRNGHSQIKQVQPRNVWSYAPFGNAHGMSPGLSDDPYYYPPSRGRSSRRSTPSNHDIHSPPYIERRDIWPDEFADDVELEEDERADTPREIPTAAEMIEKVQRDLSQLEAEEAQQTGTESQAKDALLSTSGEVAREVAREDTGKSLPPPDKDTEAVTSAGRPPTTAIPGGEQGVEDLKPTTRDDFSKMTEVEAGKTAGVDMAVVGAPVLTKEVVQPPPDGNTEAESLNNYTHDRIGDMPTRSTEASPSRAAESPPKDVPAELTGIGSAHEKHEEIRKLAFSDEDLGLLTTATANATSST